MKARLLLLCLAPLLLELPAQSAAAQPPVFMWKITDGNATAYLLGSIHAATSEFYPLDNRIEQAYSRSDALVVEANILETNPLELVGQIMAQSMYPAGDNIEKHLSPAVWKKTQAVLDDFGLPSAQFRQVKPWFLAMSLTMMKLQSLGISAENGIDLHFLHRATDTKPIRELESAGAQLDLISGFSDAEQEMFLRYTLSEMDQLEASMKKLVATWKTGNADGLEKLLLEALQEAPETKAIYTKLFDDRNVKMAEKIEGYLASGQTHFIVVGAGHLVGENGLLKLLGKKHQLTQE